MRRSESKAFRLLFLSQFLNKANIDKDLKEILKELIDGNINSNEALNKWKEKGHSCVPTIKTYKKTGKEVLEMIVTGVLPNEFFIYNQELWPNKKFYFENWDQETFSYVDFAIFEKEEDGVYRSSDGCLADVKKDMNLDEVEFEVEILIEDDDSED